MRSLIQWTGLILLAITLGGVLAFTYNFNANASGLPFFQSSPNLFTQSTPSPNTGPRGFGGWRMGPGMMNPNGYRGGYSGSGAPISLDDAVAAAEGYLASYGNPDLALVEVMDFSDNFYAEVKEQSTGIHAFEILIDRFTGYVYPEPGPNMMWNTKYGHMGGGMMGNWRNSQTGAVAVSAEQAQKLAQKWLDRYLPGTSVAKEADAFYGYYTIHVLKGDQIYGMLSVNAYTGDVWYHTWHGYFINMKELEK